MHQGDANYIVQVDITSFFDTIDREMSMEIPRNRIADGHGPACSPTGITASRAAAVELAASAGVGAAARRAPTAVCDSVRGSLCPGRPVATARRTIGRLHHGRGRRSLGGRLSLE